MTSSQVSAAVTHCSVAHAPDAEARDHERVPPGHHPALRVLAADRAAEYRVVPVHREPALVRERLRMPGHQVPELVRREFPVWPRVVGQLGQRHRAAQAVVDARAPGQQRVRPRRADRVPLPADLAARRAQRQRPLHRAPYRRPHGQRVPLVAGHQVLVPGADGDVGGVVALRRRVGHPAGLDRPRPGPVGPLGLAQPPVGPPGRARAARRRSAPSRTRRGPRRPRARPARRSPRTGPASGRWTHRSRARRPGPALPHVCCPSAIRPPRAPSPRTPPGSSRSAGSAPARRAGSRPACA